MSSIVLQGLNSGGAEPVAGVEPEIEPAAGFSSVGSRHEVEDGFLQRVALRQLIGEAQHDVKGSPVLITAEASHYKSIKSTAEASKSRS